MLRAISLFLFKLWGWKLVGDSPRDLKKYVIIAIPHTSNWDFPIGMFLRKIMREDFRYVAKASLFRFPFGWFFRWTGGIPVDRSKRNNFVDAVVQLYSEREELKLTFSPEGTRSKVDKLKSGFYYIALGAKVPIVMVKFDYGKMEIVYREPFYPTGDKEKDFAFIADYYKGTKGKVHENSWTALQ